ncbi:helix-turn-helix domain-containing protein [Clostridium sp.]|uniref:helix-turn-helix domain-containing protein n=1 Tax=Clostridium sp. TaxID=1506 RepID=UPI0035A17753
MFGDELRKWRKKRKLTQAQLGESIGVTGAYIQQLELGKKTNPSIEVIIKLCKSLDITPFDLNYEFKSNDLFTYLINRDINHSYKKNITSDLKEIDSDEIDELEQEFKEIQDKLKNISPHNRKKILKMIEIFEEDEHKE